VLECNPLHVLVHECRGILSMSMGTLGFLKSCLFSKGMRCCFSYGATYALLTFFNALDYFIRMIIFKCLDPHIELIAFFNILEWCRPHLKRLRQLWLEVMIFFIWWDP